jgi:hypothetical protein
MLLNQDSKLLGLSGDVLTINDNKIIKVCETNQERFIRNINKQKNFVNKYIKAVPILEDGIKDDKHFVVMPLILESNPMVWLSSVKLDSFFLFEQKIMLYFRSLIQASEQKRFEYKIWYDKIDELYGKITDEQLRSILMHLRSKQFQGPFYYGDCHGDFTMANMLIYKDEIYLIDFLDTFINSPLNDIVKLKQDTASYWTLHLFHNKEIDRNRVSILLNHLDNKINILIKSESALDEYYNSFQLLNLLRIIPYVKNSRTFDYLKSIIVRDFSNIYNF